MIELAPTQAYDLMFFFFQAEDGIRDYKVTGVQTCALPIWYVMSGEVEIIIPVYNEGDNIVRTLEEIESKVDHPHRILVVYDFDQDDTLPPLRRYVEKGHGGIRTEKNRYGRGALNAIRTGFEAAEGELCLICMGDLSDDMT